MIRIECGCGRTGEVPDSMAGKKGLCQGCGKVFTVPYPRAARAGRKAAAGPPEKKNVGVGLDKECEKCGDLVSYAYKSPVPGLCGKCADREVAERRRRERGRKVKRMVGGFEVEDWEEGGGRGKGLILALLVLVLLGVAFILLKMGWVKIPGLAI
ncbi:MAG: hypothetical protein HYY18_19555 [Planctomycetes bacterium]|nr:hypothetical protein [Planctomycetota bacterium]